ncbi:hypothetical protein FHS59_004149 [Algoriphagus iocasae]|uniref:Uncharacterized protein n=1 Tax=Algoriphagus iocasae TaxID=1836499 RepID=A0A841MNG2_9BACT|nr:hypothetical protein [Algoriphagus iocasae]MBB6328493.1 hypothetical protein [Algoriphagus iocasae]
MKYLLILPFLFLPFILQSQVLLSNKEFRKLEKYIKRKGISNDYDSLLNKSFTDQRKVLQTAKELPTIEKLIIGNWSQSKSSRITGELEEVPLSPNIIFSKDGRFLTIKREKEVSGRYVVNKEENFNLKLIFDEPQIPPFPEEMLKSMSQKELQKTMYTEELWNIFEIEKNQLITYQVIPIYNPSNPATLTHSRLRLNYYIKN